MVPGGTRGSSCVLSLGDLFSEMSHFYKCHVYSICSGFWLFMTHCPPPVTLLNVSVHWVFCLPVLLLPILTSHTDVAWVHLHQSTLATWPPHFYLRLKSTATMFFVLVLSLTSAFFTQSLHTTCSFLCSIFHWQLWSIFSLSMSDIQVKLVKLYRKRQGMIASDCQLSKMDSDQHKSVNNVIIWKFSSLSLPSVLCHSAVATPEHLPAEFHQVPSSHVVSTNAISSFYPLFCKMLWIWTFLQK